MPENDADQIEKPEKFVPRSIGDSVAEVERQLGSTLSLTREHIRRARVEMSGKDGKNTKPMNSSEARAIRDIGGFMMDVLKWKWPKGKPDEHDRPLEEQMRDLLEKPNAREWARKILKEYE